jgi:hypothetical protein
MLPLYPVLRRARPQDAGLVGYFIVTPWHDHGVHFSTVALLYCFKHRMDTGVCAPA